MVYYTRIKSYLISPCQLAGGAGWIPVGAVVKTFLSIVWAPSGLVEKPGFLLPMTGTLVPGPSPASE